MKEVAIRSLILDGIGQSGDSTVLAAKGKVWEGNAPQGTVSPYVIFHLISNNPERNKDGYSIEILRIQVDVYHNLRYGAISISEAIKSKLDGYIGMREGERFDKILFNDENDGFSEDKDYSIRTVDFLCRHYV
jgi:hypothetical protein